MLQLLTAVSVLTCWMMKVCEINESPIMMKLSPEVRTNEVL